MNKRHFLAALMGVMVFATGCTTTGSDAGDPATRRQSLDSGVDNALASLARQVPGSQELVGRAKGVLVFPSVLEAGFIVGASRGDGALRGRAVQLPPEEIVARAEAPGGEAQPPRATRPRDVEGPGRVADGQRDLV